MHRILIVDDDRDLRESLRTALQTDFEILQAEDGIDALGKVKSGNIDLAILDMDMPRMDGLTTLKEIKKFDPRIIVLILTAHSSVPNAVAAVREGAFNYLAKPIRHAEIRELVSRALRANAMVEQLAFSAPILQDGKKEPDLSTRSDRMQKVYEMIDKLTRVDTAVLLRGESGTGKEVVAQAIHYNSLRKDKKFVPVNLSAVPENLIESELFGHEKGAFTGAEQRKIGKFQYADGGTLFLDEIGDISPAMQVKLLRVLQEKKFTPVGANREITANVRIIAATNRNLEEMMAKNEFREDLFYRLSVLPIFLPPLRERKEDMDTLVQHFIRRFNQAHGKSIQGINAQALEKMKTHDWPGNIRELENVIEHAFVLESSPLITESSLPENLRSVRPTLRPAKTDSTASFDIRDEDLMDFQQYKEQAERDFIIRALKKYKGRINQTSAQTNIPKKTLLRKLEKYKINASDYRD